MRSALASGAGTPDNPAQHALELMPGALEVVAVGDRREVPTAAGHG
jgi:hypothetical protein